ncbi:MAG TPA: SRPBCC family protein [Cellulomonas sp.]|nr:SRPBCC family protein [Cellulomonas sp.]
MTSTTTRTQVHHSFELTREFPAPVERVWAAFAVRAEKAKWFGDPVNFDATENTDDFRVGGQAVEDGRWHDGPTSRFVATYTDIVDLQRIVYTYDMWIDGAHISTSVTTIAFEPTADGTHLTFTEQGVHLDGLDSGEGREQGTSGLLDALGASLTA